MNRSDAGRLRFLPFIDSLMARIDKDAAHGQGCWNWIGSKDVNGYGMARYEGGTRSRRAHRVVYETLVGPVPEGLVLDHLCRNRGCVNPAHLDPVTQQINTLRGIGPTAKNAVKTHCSNGHPYEGENLSMGTKGGMPIRRCKACQRAWTSTYTEKHDYNKTKRLKRALQTEAIELIQHMYDYGWDRGMAERFLAKTATGVDSSQDDAAGDAR